MDCLIGLGSNLGERERTLERAIERIGQNPHVQVVAVSSFHVTQPVGGPVGQGEFLNAVARLETNLSARSLLELLLDIEASLGRERVVKWGPRTIDLDLLLYGDQIIDEPDLKVPHPRMHQREFVLVPAQEIAADMRHPVLRQTLSDLAVLPGR